MASRGSSSIYSSGTVFSERGLAKGALSPGCATLALAAAMLALCGGLAAALSFYIMCTVSIANLSSNYSQEWRDVYLQTRNRSKTLQEIEIRGKSGNVNISLFRKRHTYLFINYKNTHNICINKTDVHLC